MLIYKGLGSGISRTHTSKSTSSRDLIDVCGLPHLSKVMIKYKEIEFLMGI